MEKPSIEQTLVKITDEALKLMKQIQVNPNWKKTADKPCDMFKMEIDNRLASRGQAILDYSFEKVISFLREEGTLPKLNPQLLQMKILQKYQGDIQVNYQKYKGMWPVSDRDLVSVAAHRPCPQTKKHYIVNRYCQAYPFPEQKGIVRAKCHIGGYIIEKIDENKTKVTYISDVDIMGSVPAMIKNSLSQKQGEIASRIGPVMSKS